MMICLRYGFVPLTLFILSVYFSYVLAQSIYDFKGKSTNIREGNRPSPSANRQYDTGTYKGKSIDIYAASRYIKLTRKIRFRYLYGTYNSDSQEASRSTFSIIWDGAGIGQSDFKYKASISDDTYELEHKSIDFAYTFGDEYTLTLGNSAIYSGNLTVTTSDSNIYDSSNVVGYGFFAIGGIEFGIFEVLLGYQYIRYTFIEIESDSNSTYMASFRDSGNQYATGIGIAF